jgi:hypothetical protein
LEKKVIESGLVVERQIQANASETLTKYHDFRSFDARYAPNIGITHADGSY